MTSNPRIVQIPMPGGSARVRTGAIQFRDDWPGLFVRGDDAIVLAVDLSHILQVLRERGLEADHRVLCGIPRIEKLMTIIEQDVKVQ